MDPDPENHPDQTGMAISWFCLKPFSPMSNCLNLMKMILKNNYFAQGQGVSGLSRCFFWHDVRIRTRDGGKGGRGGREMKN